VTPIDIQADTNALGDFKQGVSVLRDGYPNDALEYLHRAVEAEPQNPYYVSFLGLCMARTQRDWAAATQLCETALRMKRTEVQLHLNLAEVYECVGRTADAVNLLDAAPMYVGRNSRVARRRTGLGKRRGRVLPFLDRDHFLNKNLGKIRHQALT
jgi:Flp pilus assembly protein TadD